MIGRVIRTVRKLRGRDVRELRERGGQALAAWRERAGLDADARLPDAAAYAALHAHFVRRVAAGAPPFFPAFDVPAATVAALRARCPGDEADAVARADRVRAGRFDLLGYRGLSYGAPVDWHTDPVSGRRAPLLHWSRVPYLDSAVVGDHKVVWEVNRHQYFAALGQAYWYTRRESYAETFAEHAAAWMDANPPKFGVNWASSLEVAFRAISWLWALHFFAESPALTPPLLARLLRYLYLHARHLERYLSTYFSPNTHLTGEALALYYAGALLPEFAAAPRWRETGRAILLEQLARQVHPDGVYFEQASQYHRYTTEFYLHFLLLASRRDDPAVPTVRASVQALLDHLLYLARPDGTIPLVGDDDGGRLVQLDARAPDDVRALLAAGAALFDRADFAAGALAGNETSGGVRSADHLAPMLWLLGAEGLRRFDALRPAAPAAASRAFRDGGYFVMRDGWGARANYLVVDCGPHGTMNCGHAHADALAVSVAAGGRPALVDAGTYTYSGPERNAFRATAAHNTVAVDGQSASVPGDEPFQWRHVAGCALREWVSTDRFDFFEGAHDGYARLAAPAEHARGILFVKGGYWVVRDRIATAGAHHVAARWHCDPALRARVVADGVVDVEDGSAPVLRLAAFGDGRFAVEDGWVSERYGARWPAVVCVYAQAGRGAQEMITFLLPALAPTALPSVREAAARGGRAFVVEREDASDLLLLGSGGTVESGGVETDAAWAWVHRTPTGEVADCLLVRGSTLRVDGRAVLAARGRREWMALEWSGRDPAAGAAEIVANDSGRRSTRPDESDGRADDAGDKPGADAGRTGVHADAGAPGGR
jgi:Heparinase II/III-like protein/Heparinase II/III N-terminus